MKVTILVFFLSITIFLAPIQASDGFLLVANKSDDTLDIIDLATGELADRLETGPAPHEVAVSLDGSQAVIANYDQANGDTLTLVNLETRQVKTLSTGNHRGPHGVVWLTDGFLVTAEAQRELLIFDLNGKLLRAVKTDQVVSHMVAVTPDGNLALVANIGSGSVTAIDLISGEKIKDIQTGRGAEGIAVSPDGKEAWVTNRAADTVSVIEIESLKEVAEIALPSFPIRTEITPDGKWVLVSAAGSGEMVLLDRESRKIVRRVGLDLSTSTDRDGRLFANRFKQSPVPIGIEIDPDGGRFWVAATRSDVVVEMSLPELKVQRVIQTGRQPDGMAFAGSADGS